LRSGQSLSPLPFLFIGELTMAIIQDNVHFLNDIILNYEIKKGNIKMSNKSTIKDVEKYVINNSKCKLISNQYINHKSDLIFTCEVCEKEYYTSFQKFKRGKHRCNNCGGRNQCAEKLRYDYDYVSDYIKKHGCKLKSKEYKNSHTKLDIECGICREIFSLSFKEVLNKKVLSCSKCGHKRGGEKTSFTLEYVKDFITKNSDCILLSSEYKGNEEPIELLCGCKQNTFITTFSKFRHRNKRQCNKCSNTEKWNIDTAKKWVEENSNAKLLSDTFINNHRKLKFLCGECNENVFETSLSHFIHSGTRQCFKCGHKKGGEKLSTPFEKVKEYIKKHGCELISKTYVNSNNLLEIRCGLCNEIFETTYDIFKGKKIKICPSCNRRVSAGENIFKKLLKENKINFKTQHSYKDCRYKNLLKFDFLLTDLNILVEIDGEQHRRSIEYFGGIKAFKLNQVKDEIKNTYCAENNIPLIRIPYYDANEKIEIFIVRCKSIIEEIKNYIIY